MLQLLDKNELATLKAGERLKEVREGAKLAEKVDKLRELSAEEETNLRKFRDETLKRIQTEIDQKIIERETIRLENEELKKKRIEAEAPLDLVAEWDKVKIDRKELEQKTQNVLTREIEAKIAGQNARQTLEEAEHLKEKILLERGLTSEDLRVAEDDKRKAKQIREAAEKEKERIFSELEVKQGHLYSREQILSAREKVLEVSITDLKERERIARLPLDEEWAKVRKEVEDLKKERASLKEYEQLYLSQFNELEKDKSKIKAQKQESLEVSEKSKEMQRESAKLLADAHRSRDKILEEIEAQNEEYRAKVKEKEQLDKEITELAEERRLLLIPLDEEKKALKSEREEIERTKTELGARESSLKRLESGLKDTTEALEIRDKNLKGQELLTQKYLENAQDRFQTAEKERQSAVELRKKTDKEVAEEYKILESKKSGFLTSCENKRVELERREKDLEEREIQVLAAELIYKSPVKKNSNGKPSN